MNIQPVNKAVEHLINSTPVLGERRRKKEQGLSYKEQYGRKSHGVRRIAFCYEDMI